MMFRILATQPVYAALWRVIMDDCRAAVITAYGWDEGIEDAEILAALLRLNAERSGLLQAPDKAPGQLG